MKKKILTAVVAVLAIVVCAVSFTACNGGNGDVKKLYEAFSERRDKLEPVTTMTATELGDLDGTDVTVSGKALIVERTDPDTNDVNYELWVGGTSKIYTGQIAPTAFSRADWCWYVNDTAMKMITVYTADAVNQFFEFKYDGNSVILPSVSGNTLYVNGVPALEYDPETNDVTEIGESAPEEEVPTLEQEGIRIELEEVDIELVGDSAARVYDKDGKALRLVNMENLVPGRSVKVVAATKKSVFLQEIRVLPSDASDYDFYEDSDKCTLVQYRYDWKSGDLTEVELGYVVDGSDGSGLVGMVTDIFSMSVARIEDDKALIDGGIVFFDSDMNVVCDLNDIMPGATGIVAFGDLLKITDGSIVRYYDGEGNVVGEYVGSSAITEDASGLLKRGNDYFTVSGEYVFTLGIGSADDTAVKYVSVPGKIYYAERNEIDPDAEPDPEASVGDFKVYDVATGTSTTICELEKLFTFDYGNGIYIVSDGSDGYSVYNLADGSKLIDFNANAPSNIERDDFNEDVLIKYAVTHVDGSVETEESRYILIDIDEVTPELF